MISQDRAGAPLPTPGRSLENWTFDAAQPAHSRSSLPHLPLPSQSRLLSSDSLFLLLPPSLSLCGGGREASSSIPLFFLFPGREVISWRGRKGRWVEWKRGKRDTAEPELAPQGGQTRTPQCRCRQEQRFHDSNAPSTPDCTLWRPAERPTIRVTCKTKQRRERGGEGGTEGASGSIFSIMTSLVECLSLLARDDPGQWTMARSLQAPSSSRKSRFHLCTMH